MKSTVSGVCEDLKFKISEDWVRTRIKVFLALSYWLSQLNLDSKNVDFTPPLYLKSKKVLNRLMYICKCLSFTYVLAG